MARSIQNPPFKALELLHISDCAIGRAIGWRKHLIGARDYQDVTQIDHVIGPANLLIDELDSLAKNASTILEQVEISPSGGVEALSVRACEDVRETARNLKIVTGELKRGVSLLEAHIIDLKGQNLD